MTSAMSYFTPVDGKADLLLAATSIAAEQFLSQSGCVLFVWERDGDSVTTMETWTDEAAMAAHIATVEYRTFRAVIDPLLAEPFQTYPFEPDDLRMLLLG